MFLGYNRRAAEILKKANKDNIVPENNQPSEDEYVWVDGYKGMDKNMKCYGGFQYQLGGHYQIDNDPVLCKNGFHLCLNLCDVFSYYKPFGGNRFGAPPHHPEAQQQHEQLLDHQHHNQWNDGGKRIA